MTENPKVILSGFADESANHKTAVEQLAVFAAIGLRYYSLRFIDMGAGVKNAMKLTPDEIDQLNQLNREYGLRIATLGSPIGKVKLVDKEDGSHNAYIPFQKYLDEDVMRAIELAQAFNTKLLRGFSFYPPKGEDPEPYIPQAIDQLARIAERCSQAGVIYGLEIEANLVGGTGPVLQRIADEIASPALVTIFDGANLAAQNIGPEGCFEHYQAMRKSMGWMHVKDYKIDPSLTWEGFVDEERLKNFVPCDRGDAGHELIFQDLREILPEKIRLMKQLGAPGFFLDLEPHLKGGGQFGGFSGPDGMGIALRALCRCLDRAGIDYDLRTYDDIVKGD